MLLNNKDRQILDHIVKYCDEVDLAISEYGNDKETFLNNPVFRNACAMPIMQIGELAKRLSPEFCQSTPPHSLESDKRHARPVCPRLPFHE